VLFEKGKLSSIRISLDMAGCILILIIVTAYVTYGICVITEVAGSNSGENKISILNLITALAQIATASAFFLALRQYIKNSKQQRQTELSNESKSQISKIINLIKEIETGSNTNLENLNKSITLISNLATNFDALFESMDEDIQKAIVRMHWQDMYFNDLSHALIALDLQPILENTKELNGEQLQKILADVISAPSNENTIPVFKKYVYFNSILEHPIVKNSFILKDKLESLDTFTYHFLNDSNLNDHLYGLLSRVDIRAKAPLLAAAKPAEWALKTKNTKQNTE